MHWSMENNFIYMIKKNMFLCKELNINHKILFYKKEF
jgi:hypothetical protein